MSRYSRVFVTHDQEEALEVADRVVLMNEGRVEQVSPPDEVYHHPANAFVYNFLGNVNLFHGRVHAGRIQIGEMEIDAPEHVQEGPAIAYVRPYDLELDRIRGNGGSIEAIIRDIHAAGALVRLDLERSDSQGMIEAELTRDRYNELELQEGERVFVRPRNLRVL